MSFRAQAGLAEIMFNKIRKIISAMTFGQHFAFGPRYNHFVITQGQSGGEATKRCLSDLIKFKSGIGGI